MYCHNCGKQVSDNSKFCRYCGAALSEENAAEEKPKTGDDLFGFENKAESGAQNGGAQQQGNAQQGNYQYGPGSYYTPQGGGQPGNYGYQYGRYTAPDDAKSVGFGVLGFFFPVVLYPLADLARRSPSARQIVLKGRAGGRGFLCVDRYHCRDRNLRRRTGRFGILLLLLLTENAKSRARAGGAKEE